LGLHIQDCIAFNDAPPAPFRKENLGSPQPGRIRCGADHGTGLPPTVATGASDHPGSLPAVTRTGCAAALGTHRSTPFCWVSTAACLLTHHPQPTSRYHLIQPCHPLGGTGPLPFPFCTVHLLTSPQGPPHLTMQDSTPHTGLKDLEGPPPFTGIRTTGTDRDHLLPIQSHRLEPLLLSLPACYRTL